MEINREIAEILKESKINIQSGTLVLLGIYFNLNVDNICPEEIVKAINTTKIVVKDYNTNTFVWNVPLFMGQETQFGWVGDWNNRFGRANPSRQDNLSDVTKRMKEFFAKYPQYRKDDVIKSTNAYLSSVKDMQYLKSSAKFIFEGTGGMKKSLLLTWCEKVTSTDTDQKGKILT